uniref:Uncharacterized protein n=1 Tax=Anguilla anguilla TaxID=7936 RepID=A0A0E9R0C7_ANGAN
MGTLYVIILS